MFTEGVGDVTMISRWSMIVRMSVVLRRTVYSDFDWRFDDLSEVTIRVKWHWYDSWIQTIYSEKRKKTFYPRVLSYGLVA